MQKFEISPEYLTQILEELSESTVSYIQESTEEDEVTLSEALEAWYHNLMDDLHDSAGDRLYQQGILERMQVTEYGFPSIITPYSDEDKLVDAPWAK